MSMCRVLSCVVGRGCLLWPVRPLGRNSISICPAWFFTPRPNFPVTPVISWLPTFAFQCLIMKITSFFWLLVLEGLIGLLSLVGLHKTIQVQLLQQYWSGVDLDYCDIKRFALEMNRDHSIVFEIASKYCISDSFVSNIMQSDLKFQLPLTLSSTFCLSILTADVLGPHRETRSHPRGTFHSNTLKNTCLPSLFFSFLPARVKIPKLGLMPWRPPSQYFSHCVVTCGLTVHLSWGWRHCLPFLMLYPQHTVLNIQ